jgi:hypothetical protein
LGGVVDPAFDLVVDPAFDLPANRTSVGAPFLPSFGRSGIEQPADPSGLAFTPAPRASAHGSLVHYICSADPNHFQPANITFDLLEQLDEATRRKVRDKKLRHQMVCDRAFAAFADWFQQLPPAVR